MKSRILAILGLVLVALLCVQLLIGAITLQTAATRAVVLVVVLAVVDRLIVPIGRMLVGDPRAAAEEDDEAGAGRRDADGTMPNGTPAADERAR